MRTTEVNPVTDVDRMLRIAREQRPDLWARTEAVARIIDPAAFQDDWIVDPPESARLFAAKLAYLRSNAMGRAQEVLQYLGVNTDHDWHDILARLAKEGAYVQPINDDRAQAAVARLQKMKR
jgi:hypothetical protein